MCKVYTGYHATSEIEHSLSACMADHLSVLADQPHIKYKTSIFEL